MNKKEIIHMLRTDVRVFKPANYGRTHVLTTNLDAAKSLLQNGDFNPTAILLSLWTRPRRIFWFNLNIVPTEEE